MKDTAAELRRRAAWKTAVQTGDVTAHRVGDSVTVEAPGESAVTATLPDGTTPAGAAHGEAYAGAVSGWTPSAGTPLGFTLSALAALSADESAETAPDTRPAPDAKVPDGVSEPVPYTAEN